MDPTMILIELIVGTFFGIVSMYACLKLALMIRPSRRVGWAKVRGYALTTALLLGAIIAGFVLLEVVLYVT